MKRYTPDGFGVILWLYVLAMLTCAAVIAASGLR